MQTYAFHELLPDIQAYVFARYSSDIEASTTDEIYTELNSWRFTERGERIA